MLYIQKTTYLGHLAFVFLHNVVEFIPKPVRIWFKTDSRHPNDTIFAQHDLFYKKHHQKRHATFKMQTHLPLRSSL